MRYTKTEAIGYMIMSLNETNLSEKEKEEIVHNVSVFMDQWTEQVAEEEYDHFYGI